MNGLKQLNKTTDKKFINMNIFHIGFSKCASSWLQTFFSSAKEINYLEKTHFLAHYTIMTALTLMLNIQ